MSTQASTLGGPLSADRPARVAVCGSTVSGPASVTGAAGPVLLGGASGTPCRADTVTGVVNLIGNVGDVTLGGATINGPAQLAQHLLISRRQLRTVLALTGRHISHWCLLISQELHRC